MPHLYIEGRTADAEGVDFRLMHTKNKKITTRYERNNHTYDVSYHVQLSDDLEEILEATVDKDSHCRIFMPRELYEKFLEDLVEEGRIIMEARLSRRSKCTEAMLFTARKSEAETVSELVEHLTIVPTANGVTITVEDLKTMTRALIMHGMVKKKMEVENGC